MATLPPILVVDHNRRNLELLAQFLGQAGYPMVLAYDAEEFGLALDRSDEIGLALIDLAGLGRRIWDPCERLRAKGIPLLVISPRQSVAIERESLAHGARSVLIKPLVVKELLALIRGLLEE